MFEKIIDPRPMLDKYSRELSRFPAFCFSSFPRAFFFLFSSISPLTTSLQVTILINSFRGSCSYQLRLLTAEKNCLATSNEEYSKQQSRRGNHTSNGTCCSYGFIPRSRAAGNFAETRLTIQVLLVQVLLEEV